MESELWKATLSDLMALLETRQVSSLDLVTASVARISNMDRIGPALRAMIELNPEAESIARALDDERSAGTTRGPLHGIPILIKDNIDTADTMETTAGSLALLGGSRQRDATVAAKLRAAGAVLLGKTNLSEWANFRSSHSSSGWSGRGGQARNPHVLDRTPIGSSSGSGSAVAAGYAAASIGTETSGSIICPAAACGVVGLKPTVGLVSRTGIVPISHVQDTAGPFARTVRDAALLLGVIAGPDDADAATARFAGTRIPTDLDVDALRGARLGVPRKPFYGYDARADAVVEAALRVMADAGAEIVDPVEIPSVAELTSEEGLMFGLLLHEFKADINAYLAGLPESIPNRTLGDLIAFNRAHAGEEMPYFGQEWFEQAEARPGLDDPGYRETRARASRLAREEGIDAALRRHNLDALIAPTTGVPWRIDLEHGDPDGGGSCSWLPALAGYPAYSVPAGFVGSLPIGVTFMGTAGSDPRLLHLAHAFESHGGGFREPEYLSTQADDIPHE